MIQVVQNNNMIHQYTQHGMNEFHEGKALSRDGEIKPLFSPVSCEVKG